MKILFLCVANSARSQMAEGLAKNLFGQKNEIYSAGSEPSGVVNKFAIEALHEMNIDISKNHSKSWDSLPATFFASIDYIITLCQEEVCPNVASNARKLHWGMSDPSVLGRSDSEKLEAFRKTRDAILDKLNAFKSEHHL